MRKGIGLALMLGLALLVTACGPTSEKAVNADAQDKVKTISGREIIAELEQTATDTTKRDAVVNNADFSGDLAVQTIEADAVFDAMEKVYGSYEAFRKEGVIFFENQAQGAEHSGIWLGIKEPDERLGDMLNLLQLQVDAGEILAEPIYFYRSDYTEIDLEHLQEKVLNALKPMTPERGSFGISSDIMTGHIEITHDFLKEEQQKELRQQFLDYTIRFEQEGRLIAEPGVSATTYPDEAFTTTPSTEGTYVMRIDEGEMLVVDTLPTDYGATGGEEDYYGAIIFKYPDAVAELKVGQRVKVESSGFILTSYPGQGSAKYVEVLPEYKPQHAKLSESEVVVKTVDWAKKKSDGMVIIRSIVFDENTASWKVEVKQRGTGEKDEEYDVTIKDE